MLLRRNVLIFHSGALGDFVLTWPLALGVARTLAQRRIFYVTHASKGALAERVLRVESADAEAGWHGLFSEQPQLPSAAAKLLGSTEWVFNFVSCPGDRWTDNVAQLAPEAKMITLSPRPPEDARRHAVHHLIDQLADYPVFRAATEQMLMAIAARGLAPRDRPDGPIVLHPGSGSQSKNWPAARFAALARSLAKGGLKVIFTFGEAEQERMPSDVARELEAAAPIVRPGSYLELYDLLKSAAALVVNDSGPGHLGAMLGTPTVSLFGPTDPTVWAPIGPHVAVLRKASLGEIDVAEVEAAVRSVRASEAAE